MLKKCSKCGIEKNVTEFNKYKRNKDGLASQCKACKNSAYTKNCECCGKEFKTGNKRAKYCSVQCTGRSQTGENHPNWNGGLVEYDCEMCGKKTKKTKFLYEKHKHHYCSPECRYKGISENYRGEKRYNFSLKAIKCDQCGKRIFKKPSRMNRNNKNFCSIECSSAYISENYKGDKRYNYKPELTDEERLKNISRHNSIKYRKWMREVLKRDDYTCVITGIRGNGELNVHHLDGWNWCKEKRYDISNGVTLRKEIHDLFHEIYGKGDNTKEQFEEFKIRYFNNEFEVTNMIIPR